MFVVTNICFLAGVDRQAGVSLLALYRLLGVIFSYLLQRMPHRRRVWESVGTESYNLVECVTNYRWSTLIIT